MKALYQVDYPTPKPLSHNRHVVCMSLLRGLPLYQIHSSRLSEQQAESIFQQSTALTCRLAHHGLVHCDLNEFNLLVDLSGIQDSISDNNDVGEHYVRHSGMSVVTKGALSAHGPLEKHAFDGTGEVIAETPPAPRELLDNGEPKPIVTLIDFPQMVSTRHPNAQELYERDLSCLKRFFVKKLKCVPESGWDELIPKWQDYVLEEEDSIASRAQVRLDQELQASGFSQQDSSRDVELYYYEREQGLAEVVDKNGSEVEESVDDEDLDDSDDDEAADQHQDVQANEELDSDNDSTSDDRQEQVSQIDTSLLEAQSRAKAEEKARARVRRQLEDQKKRNGKKGAFRSRNSNKTYVKGKRVVNDVGY